MPHGSGSRWAGGPLRVRAAYRHNLGVQIRRLLGQIVAPRWRWATLLVLLAIAANVALGFWQLGRLQRRHATSAELTARLSAPPVALAGADVSNAAAIDSLQFRRASVRGTFDVQHEAALVNEVWNGKLGLHLLTPLLVVGTGEAVIVDRGWIPAEDADPGTWSKYAPSAGPVDVTGWVREPRHGRAGPVGADRLVDDVDVQRLAGFVGRKLLPVYLIQVPDGPPGAAQGGPPFRTPPVTDLGDGVHLIVAAQWFALAVIIAAGYLAYANKQLAASAVGVAAAATTGRRRSAGPPPGPLRPRSSARG